MDSPASAVNGVWRKGPVCPTRAPRFGPPDPPGVGGRSRDAARGPAGQNLDVSDTDDRVPASDVHSPVDQPVSTGSAAAPEILGFDCPRCGNRAEEPYYGPCGSCRAELRTTVEATPDDVEVAAYEPKMNVTPNAVALKE